MPSFHTARVTDILMVRPGLQRVRVAFDDDVPGDRAYVLTELTGAVDVGDDVVCNTTAVELGLGTGGWHVVHWNLARPSFVRPGPDHVMKLRYTSLQFDAGTSELAHPNLPEALDGTPVVVCLVHSQVAVVAATIRHMDPTLLITYVMTDGAALPIVLSDLVAEMRDGDVVCGTVTAGHAFGGDLESVTVASALLLARHVQRADVIIVGMGPGVVGTGSRYGASSIDAASALDVADALGGQPVLCVRASSGDGRERHQGISHHTHTVASLASPGFVVGAIPDDVVSLPHAAVREVAIPDVAAALAASNLVVTTMGRSVDEDRVFFDAAAAAAVVAVELSR